MPDMDDAAIAEFHAAARRRQIRIFAITSLVCLAIGIAILVVVFTAGAAAPSSPYSRGTAIRYEVRTLVFGVAFVVAGGAAAWKAFRIRTGAALD